MWGDLSISRLVISLDNVVDTQRLKQTSVSGNTLLCYLKVKLQKWNGVLGDSSTTEVAVTSRQIKNYMLKIYTQKKVSCNIP